MKRHRTALLGLQFDTSPMSFSKERTRPELLFEKIEELAAVIY
jgi:hypothetical protein